MLDKYVHYAERMYGLQASKTQQWGEIFVRLDKLEKKLEERT